MLVRLGNTKEFTKQPSIDMKKLALLLIILISFSAFSQERCLEELGELLDPSTELYWNPHDDVLDINGFQIPIDYIRLQHTSVNTLRFVAEHPNTYPIFNSEADRNITEVEFKFKSKADVYRAMEIIDKIKFC